MSATGITEGTQTVITWSPQPRQARLISCQANEIFFGGARGGGKRLSLDTPIPTPDGWKLNGDIQPGDFVIGENGLPVLVEWVSEVVTDEDAYRLSFSDGTSIVACGDHLWKTMTKKDRVAVLRRDPVHMANRRNNRASRASGKGIRPHVAAANAARVYDLLPTPTGSIRTTKDIYDTLYIKGEVNHSIQNHDPIEAPGEPLPIGPYTLGAWLGDGSTSDSRFTGVDPEIFYEIEKDGFQVMHHADPQSHSIKGILPPLRENGLLGDKHIPMVYLRGSKNNRIALLQGLMDTDGWCEKDGSCKIALTCERLFDGVVELIRTLGITVNVTKGLKTATNGTPGNATLCWTATFVSSIPVFRLPRKLARQNLNPHHRYTRRFIVAAENIGPVPMKCIRIKNPDGMYLAGKMMIPTHNTDAVIGHFYARQNKYGSLAQGLVLRRTLKALKAFIKRLKEVYGAVYPVKDCWREQENTWTFPNGASIVCGYLENLDDLEQYQGHSYSFIYPEELPQWELESAYEMLFAINRPSGHKIGDPFSEKCQIVSTGNPGGSGMKWVKKRFIDFAPPEKIVEVEIPNPKDKNKPFHKTRVFIQSKVTDNAYYANTPYEVALLGLPDRLRKMYYDGNLDVSEGQFFDEWDATAHVCRAFNPPPDWERWMAMDWGYSDHPYVCGWLCRNPSGRIYLYDEMAGVAEDGVHGNREEAREVAQKIRQRESRRGDHITERWADKAIMSGEGQESSISGLFEKEGVFFKGARKDKKEASIQILRSYMQVRNGVSQFVIMDNCRFTIGSLPGLQTSQINPEQYDTKGLDDAADMLIYAFRKDLPTNEDMKALANVSQRHQPSYGKYGWR